MTGVLVMILVMVGVSGVVAQDGEIVPNEPDYSSTNANIEQLVGDAVKKQLKRFSQQVNDHLTLLGEKVDAVKAEVEQLKQQEEAAKDEVKAEVEQLKQQQEATKDEVKIELITQLARVATRDDLLTHRAKIVTLTSVLAKEATLAAKVEGVVALQMEQVSQKINNLRHECVSCGKADSLAQVLNLVNSTQRSLTTLIQHTENTSHTQATSCSQGCASVSQTVEKLARERCEATTTLTGNVAELQTAVDNIQNQLVIVVNYTSPPPSPLTLVPGSRERTPCEDSTFVGVQPSLNVCTAAVRFQRCRVNILSYHCCRTCTRSGQIPADGPWRFYNYSRTVKLIQALQLMRLSI